jgi:SAM-dependent methyltransferase
VIEHVPEDRVLFEEMARVLRPDGMLIIGTPDYGRVLWRILEWLYGMVHPGGYAQDHITHYTRDSLLRQLNAAGFEVRSYQYVGFCELIIEAHKMRDRELRECFGSA